MVACVLLFPGQGTQHLGMGRDLATRFPEARDAFEAIDDALGVSLSRLMWDGPADELTLTHNAQPAILAHSVVVYQLLAAHLRPAAAAGHSLGEYSAYVAAQALTAPDAARLVRRRGELMLEAGRARPGAMAAVMGLPNDTVESACAAASDGDTVVVAANLNAPEQTVISGDPDAVFRAGETCRERGAKRVLPLNVSGAFHSPLMEPARHGLEAELARVAFADPAFPVVANATAEPVTDAATARRGLGEQLVAPVRWVASMRRVAALAGPTTEFVEVGPGKVLAGLLKRIVPEARIRSVGTADQVETLLEDAA